jgi:hypothetical protein
LGRFSIIFNGGSFKPRALRPAPRPTFDRPKAGKKRFSAAMAFLWRKVSVLSGGGCDPDSFCFHSEVPFRLADVCSVTLLAEDLDHFNLQPSTFNLQPS